MKKQEYYVTLKLKIESDPLEDLIDKETIDERFKKEFSYIFDNEDIEVREFKTKLKVKDIN